MIASSSDKSSFLYKFLLSDTQVSKICKAF